MTPPDLKFYPRPVTNSGPILGFLPNSTGLEDTAILTVSSFSSMSMGIPNPQLAILAFSILIGDFLKIAKASGRKRLILDLQSNGGGQIAAGFDTFKWLLPNHTVRDQGNFRVSKLVDQIGNSIDYNAAIAAMQSSNSGHDFEYALDDDETEVIASSQFFAPQDVSPDVFSYKNYASASGSSNETRPFASWREMFGSGSTHFTTRDTPTWLITAATELGAASKITDKTPPFDPENILIISDGHCHSMCHALQTLLKTSTNYAVKNFVFGGYPYPRAMPDSSGVKGAQLSRFTNIYGFAAFPLRTGANGTPSPEILQKYKGTPLGEIGETFQYLDKRGIMGGVNLRNFLDPTNPDDGSNEQFWDRMADCHLYYTMNMLADASEVWRVAAEARWGGSGSWRCKQ